jgi:hypothetical protein
MKRARDLLLDFTITKEEFEEITTELQVQKLNTEHKIQVLSKADNEFTKSLGTIFELLAKAHELFKSSEIEEKRRIITIMFPNLLLDQENLIITPRKPFDLFLNSGGYTNWQERLRTLRTKRMEDVLNFASYFQALGLAV